MIILRVKIFSYASRPYENILTTKIFNNENLEHKVHNAYVHKRLLAETVAVGRSNGIMYSRSPQHVGVTMRQGSLQTRRIDTKERSRRRSSDFYPSEK